MTLSPLGNPGSSLVQGLNVILPAKSLYHMRRQTCETYWDQDIGAVTNHRWCLWCPLMGKRHLGWLSSHENYLGVAWSGWPFG